MKKVFLTSLMFNLVFFASAQEGKPPKPVAPAEPVVEKAIEVIPPGLPLLSPAPPPPVPRMPPAIKELLRDEHSMFLKRNPGVSSVYWDNDSVIIRRKSGKEERYNLADENSMKAATEKYGDIPEAPPPPPPPHPMPPIM
jgi:hypothetical protein